MLERANHAYRAAPGEKHHLARNFSGIFAHYTANIVMTALFSIAYEGYDTHSFGVIITAG
jgi:hypothetical protein